MRSDVADATRPGAAPSPIPIDPSTGLPTGFAEHSGAIAILMAGHHLRRLNLLYRAFEGDLLLPIVLGEIALHRERPEGRRRASAVADDRLVYRLSRLGPATGIPRESARRKALRLVELGWLEMAGSSCFAFSVCAEEYFGFDYNRQYLDDFLWTAGRLRELLAFHSSAEHHAALRRDLHVALATRIEDLPQPRFSTEFTPPPGYPAERLHGVLANVAALLGEFSLRHLLRLRDAFGGDLLVPLLLGEVAHYNIASLSYRSTVDLATLDAMERGEPEEQRELFMRLMRPCNAHSLGLVTGVPDSTVRRKVAVLAERGWIATMPDGSHVVTDRPRVEFERMNLDALRDFFDTELKLRRELARAGETASPPIP
jgi:hypothetical protein